MTPTTTCEVEWKESLAVWKEAARRNGDTHLIAVRDYGYPVFTWFCQTMADAQRRSEEEDQKNIAVAKRLHLKQPRDTGREIVLITVNE